MSQNKQTQTRMSYAQEHIELAADNPLNAKTDALTPAFERQRCPLNAQQLSQDTMNSDNRDAEREAFKAVRRGQGQGSQMIRNHKPHPELRPSHALSAGPKARSYTEDLEKERQRAKRENTIAEGRAIIGRLQGHIAFLHQALREADNINKPLRGKTLAQVEREGFKLMRRVEERSADVFSRSQTFRNSISK